MIAEEIVISHLEALQRGLGIGSTTPVGIHAGMGEGTVKVRFGAAYCTADWWDRGVVFTLFLGRHYEISGCRFITEFAVEALVEAPLGRVVGYENIEDQIRKQFELLHKHGLNWLRGDFSREPFIRHKVLPDREEA